MSIEAEKGRSVRGLMGHAGVLAGALLLSGCLSLGGKAPDQLIALTPDNAAPAGDMPVAALTEGLIVLDPDTDRRLDVQRVPVQVDDATIAYLKDAAWVERPARQFRRLVAETIRARGKLLVLESGDVNQSGRAHLGGRLLDMGYDARSQSVVVRFDAMRWEPAGQAVSRRFEATIPGVAPEARSIVPALNRAANDVAKQVADWIG